MRKTPADPNKRLPLWLYSSNRLTVRDILRLTGWSRATLYRRFTQDGFPKPAKTSSHAYIWDGAEVRHWIARYNLTLRHSPEQLAKYEVQRRFEAALPTEAERQKFRFARFLEAESERSRRKK